MEKALSFDPVQVEVWRHLLASVAEEMGTTLERTAYSPNIKERLDYSCALFDAEGRLLAQAAHIPVHLGAMPLMLENLRPKVRWSPGVMWLCNDPRVGGTHLPDLTLVAPVYLPGAARGRRPVGYVASRAHHADIGGLTPGSLPLSTELFHEGLILSPVRLVERGKVREEIRDLVCANSRTPQERRGDLAAQVGANETGIRRFQALLARYGAEQFRMRTLENIGFAAASIRAAVRRLPPGVYRATDVLDDDGAGNRDIPIVLTLTVAAEGSIHFDFTGTAAQVRGSLNATEAITRSACYYAVRLSGAGGDPYECGMLYGYCGDGSGRLPCQCAFSGCGGSGECGDFAADCRCLFPRPGAGRAGTASRRQSGHDEQCDHRRNRSRTRQTVRILRNDCGRSRCFAARVWPVGSTLSHDQHPQHSGGSLRVTLSLTCFGILHQLWNGRRGPACRRQRAGAAGSTAGGVPGLAIDGASHSSTVRHGRWRRWRGWEPTP